MKTKLTSHNSKEQTKRVSIIGKTYDFNGYLSHLKLRFNKDTFEITPFQYLQLISQGLKFEE